MHGNLFCDDLVNRKQEKEGAVKREKEGAQYLYHSRIISFERVVACNFFAFPQHLAAVSRWRFISGMGRVYFVFSCTNYAVMTLYQHYNGFARRGIVRV